MPLELTANPGGQGTRAPWETRASRACLVPQERREKPVTRETRDRTVPPARGAALGKEDRGGPQVCGAHGGTRAKLDPKVTRDEKAPSVSPETRARLAPLDLKVTEVTRGPRGLRVPEELQDPQDPLETPG